VAYVLTQRRLLQGLMPALLLALGLSSHHSALAQASQAPEAQQNAPAAPATSRNWWDSNVWNDPDRGFNWYPPDRPKPKPAPARSAPPAPAVPAPAPTAAVPVGAPTSAAARPLRELTSLADIQKEVNRLHEQAILNPTEKNVLEFLKAQEWVVSKSSLYTDVARRVIWQNPEVDPTSRHSLATYAASNQRQRVEQQREDVMVGIGKTHGLLFFFRGDCPFCHDMAPVVKAVSDRYGMPVVAVSLDGGRVQPFPNARRDNGVSKFVTGGEGVQTVPALYLVANDAKTVTLLGTGALAGDEIVERVRVLKTTRPGQAM
jgi:conjugal transfer pilus assembly protein TraF